MWVSQGMKPDWEKIGPKGSTKFANMFMIQELATLLWSSGPVFRPLQETAYSLDNVGANLNVEIRHFLIKN